jgi:hypothetical protein
MVLVFVVQTIMAMFQRRFELLGFWSWIAGAETAAWRLKWVAIPVTFLTVWLGRKLYRSIKHEPERFCGVKYARRGLLASATVSLLIATLIGITVPARLRSRNTQIEAAIRAEAAAVDLAFFRHQMARKTLPDEVRTREDLATLPDPDGSIATALRVLETATYQPRAEVASLSTEKPSSMRTPFRKASLNSSTDDSTPTGLAFNHYEVRLPGEDKILGNEDDWIVRDGIVTRAADDAKGGLGKIAGSLKP